MSDSDIVLPTRPIGGVIPKPSNPWLAEYILKDKWQMPSFESRVSRKTQITHEIEDLEKRITSLTRMAKRDATQETALQGLKELVDRLKAQKETIL